MPPPTPIPATTATVVIPVHNEADYVEGGLRQLFAEIASVDASVEVLAVENGSTDDTAAIITRLTKSMPGLSLLHLDTPDYGAAMRAGFMASTAEWVVNFDIDYFSGDFLAGAITRHDADVVLASKRAPGSNDRRSRFRKVATWGFNLLLRTILGSRVSDTHGMKAIRRKVIDGVAAEVVSTKDLFDTELVIRAERAGFRIVEVPVTVEERRQSRSRLIRRIPRTVRGLWRIRRNLH